MYWICREYVANILVTWKLNIYWIYIEYTRNLKTEFPPNIHETWSFWIYIEYIRNLKPAKSSGYVPFSCQKSIKCLINNKGHCPLITFWLCPLHSWQVHQPLKDWQKCWPKLGLLCSISMTTLTVSVQSNQGSLNIQPSIPCWLKIANKFKL